MLLRVQGGCMHNGGNNLSSVLCCCWHGIIGHCCDTSSIQQTFTLFNLMVSSVIWLNAPYTICTVFELREAGRLYILCKWCVSMCVPSSQCVCIILQYTVH